MKAYGATGEIREFECNLCRSRQRRYFAYFEKPETFAVIECSDCNGHAWLVDCSGNRAVMMKSACA